MFEISKKTKCLKNDKKDIDIEQTSNYIDIESHTHIKRHRFIRKDIASRIYAKKTSNYMHKITFFHHFFTKTSHFSLKTTLALNKNAKNGKKVQ